MYERFTVQVSGREELVRELVCAANQSGRFVQAIPCSVGLILVFEREITSVPLKGCTTLAGDLSE